MNWPRAGMNSVLDVWLCTTTQHEPWLLVLTAAICITAAMVGMGLYAHALKAPRQTRSLWLAAAGASAGSGVWVTHFAATIGFHHISSVGAYDPVLTLASLGVAILGFWSAFAVAGQGGTLARAGAGVGLGLVIAGLHYIGVRALAVSGIMTFAPPIATASIILGCAGGCAAMLSAGDGRKPRRVFAGAVLLALGVAGLHFVGMTALGVDGGGQDPLLARAVGAGTLSAYMGVVAAVVMASVFGAALFATRIRNQALEGVQVALRAMPAGVALFDAQERLVTWNERYAELGGQARWVLQPGRTFRELLQAEVDAGRHPCAAGREAEWIEARLAGRRAEQDEEQRHGDTWIRVQDRRTPEGGIVSIMTDVSELKSVAEALAGARDRAEAANKAKSEFLANMSHELRTPLNGVVGLASVLARSPLDPAARDLARVIESSALVLERLIYDVLDLTQIESGRLEFRPEPLDLHGLVKDLATLHGAAAERKGLSFDCVLGPGVPAWVLGDPLRVQQVLNNLLSNAVKFTEAGSILLRVTSAGPSAVRFDVQDTGIGFEPEQAGALFERFKQADSSVTRRFGGSGLGLAISRDLAGLMGGEISCQSSPGAGSRFTLQLPLAPVAPVIALQAA